MDITNQTILYYLDNRDKVNELTDEQKSECINYCVNLFGPNLNTDVSYEELQSNLYTDIGYFVVKESLENIENIQKLNEYQRKDCISFCRVLFGDTEEEIKQVNKYIRRLHRRFDRRYLDKFKNSPIVILLFISYCLQNSILF